MAEPATSQMTVEEFLRWEPRDGRKYELVQGRPVAMSPPASAHGTIGARLTHRVNAVVETRPPCRAQTEAGVRIPGDAYTLYQADLAVTCVPHRLGQQELESPILIVEVLSPGTEDFDRKVKLPDYRTIDSVQEILLIDSMTPHAEVYRRLSGGDWLAIIVRGRNARLDLRSVGLDVEMSILYAGLETKDIVAPG